MRLRLLLALPLLVPVAARTQSADTSLTIDRLFRGEEFRSPTPPTIHWLRDGRSYLEVRENAQGGTDIVRVDAVTGQASVVADARSLVDASGKRIEVEEIVLSGDESKALLFHSSVRVWRENTRGVFHVLDFTTGKATVIARIIDRDAPSQRADTASQPILGTNPSFVASPVRSGLQMFAKFSPNGRQVAFVSDNDLFVTDLASGATRRLTTDGSADIINGTTDWVYEEELGLRDAFRWSPDSRRIAYWRFDQSAVPAFPMVNELSLYPQVSVLRYPKAGQPNSRVRIGVMDVASGNTTWMQTGPDTGIYLARAEWVDNDSLVILRLPRRQNRVHALMVSAATGRERTLFIDSDSAYVDVQDVVWVGEGRQFLWLSDRSGWRQIHLFDRSGRALRQLTQNGMDVLSIAGVDERRGEVYFIAAAPNPTQHQLFAASLRNGRLRRVSQAAGVHRVTISPDARYAVDVHSTLRTPPTVTLYELPNFTRRRVLSDNAQLRDRLAGLGIGGEFFQIPMPDGVRLDAYRITPPGFNTTRKHPVLIYVYGGPASPQVNDQYGGPRYLWHLMMAQRGYVVISVDNRGAAWRGRDFRKVTQLRLGQHEVRDQIDAVKWLGQQSWVDASRIGIWGWSYGGYMTALATGRGGDLFRIGIVGAPVTDWRLYDTIYTERLMWIPQENKQGYDESAPQTYVAGITARLLLIHGTGDDNVHPQNTMQFAEKLIAANKPFSMLLYPNRTHTIMVGSAQAHLFDQLTRFVLANL
jgi:dipeptidyl-peptidase-4